MSFGIQKCEKILCLVLDEPFELIRIFRGIHYRLIKWFTTTICGVFDNTKVLVCGLILGCGLLFQGSCHDSNNGSQFQSQSNLTIKMILEKLRVSSQVSMVRIINDEDMARTRAWNADPISNLEEYAFFDS